MLMIEQKQFVYVLLPWWENGSETHNPESFCTILDVPVHYIEAIQLMGGTQ
jgi:hypothetical protein